MMKSVGYDMDLRKGMTSRMEEAMSRLTLAIEDMEESKRKEELKKEVGDQWIMIAKVTDRYTWYPLCPGLA